MNAKETHPAAKHDHGSAIHTVEKAVDKALENADSVGGAAKSVAEDLASNGGGVLGREAGTIIGTTIAGPPGGVVGGKIGEFVGNRVGSELADLGVDVANKGIDEVGEKIVGEIKGAWDKEERKISRANRKLMRHFKKHPEQAEIKDAYVEKMQDARELRDLSNQIGVEPEEVRANYIKTAKQAQKDCRDQILEVYRATKTAAKQKAHDAKQASTQAHAEVPAETASVKM